MDFTKNRVYSAGDTDLVPNNVTIPDGDIFNMPDGNLRETGSPMSLVIAVKMPDGESDKTANLDIYHYETKTEKWFLYKSFINVANLSSQLIHVFSDKFFVRIASTTLVAGDITVYGGNAANMQGDALIELDNVTIGNVDIDKVGGAAISLGRKPAIESLPVTPDEETLAVFKDMAEISDEIATFSDAVPITAANGTITFTKKTKVTRMEIHLSANPTTNEDFLITKDDADNPAFDVVKFREDLSIPASDPVKDVNHPFNDVVMSGDKWIITWPNSESRTYGVILFGLELE